LEDFLDTLKIIRGQFRMIRERLKDHREGTGAVGTQEVASARWCVSTNFTGCDGANTVDATASA
jgi:hypothetical protein